MKKTLLAVVLSSLSVAAMAENWKFAPGLTDSGFKFQPTIAATVSSVKPQGGSSATAYGLDMNFNCGLIQPKNFIRIGGIDLWLKWHRSGVFQKTGFHAPILYENSRPIVKI